MPKFEIDSVEDLHAYYVYIIGINDFDFWHLPIQTVHIMAENKTAIESFINNEEEKQAKKKR
ncbi:hypothetical protein [Paenilisteria rocourtiae]|uniref:Uncharacterized protein n=1 Tax=Listeria rocourtiae TaxID=647910 RepID=A0A4R6ZHU7_9LIST|nr:hypothetical protein [Listeria rocourtiae]EUJ46664.1 hypothetical protein PROCOU_11133 [Listeria rocourtiae FSL F6-920]TDR51735.1 hypothetical protein DFP96_11141 [Listeria rocourtiae]